jgi:hypothetical protein
MEEYFKTVTNGLLVSLFVRYCLTIFLSRDISSNLKMEATRSSETSVHNKPTQRHTPEGGILQK